MDRVCSAWTLERAGSVPPDPKRRQRWRRRPAGRRALVPAVESRWCGPQQRREAEEETAEAAYGSQSARATRWPPMSMPSAYAAPDAADISPRRPVRRSASYLREARVAAFRNCGAECAEFDLRVALERVGDAGAERDHRWRRRWRRAASPDEHRDRRALRGRAAAMLAVTHGAARRSATPIVSESRLGLAGVTTMSSEPDHSSLLQPPLTPASPSCCSRTAPA